ncbi:MAG: type II toxin-antitoxin system HicA family toxin [Lachnospiraceae bacterium]|nr:type II toxin-antitoxin system HicA family toxin [Lachnospiraceae bacterium]
MPSKIPILRPAQVIRALEKAGFRFVSQIGSHRKYSDGKHTVIIPMHRELAGGTLRSVLLQADMTIEELSLYL